MCLNRLCGKYGLVDSTTVSSTFQFWCSVSAPLFCGSSALARGASYGIRNPPYPLPWGAHGAIMDAELHALTAGACPDAVLVLKHVSGY